MFNEVCTLNKTMGLPKTNQEFQKLLSEIKKKYFQKILYI